MYRNQGMGLHHGRWTKTFQHDLVPSCFNVNIKCILRQRTTLLYTFLLPFQHTTSILEPAILYTGLSNRAVARKKDRYGRSPVLWYDTKKNML